MKTILLPPSVKIYSIFLPCIILLLGLLTTLLEAIITLNLSIPYIFSIITSFLLTYFSPYFMNFLTSKILMSKIILVFIFGVIIGIFFSYNGYAFNHYVLRGSNTLGLGEFIVITFYSLIGTIAGSVTGYCSRKWHNELLKFKYNSIFCLIFTSLTGALCIGGSIGLLINSPHAIYFMILGFVFPRIVSFILRAVSHFGGNINPKVR